MDGRMNEWPKKNVSKVYFVEIIILELPCNILQIRVNVLDVKYTNF